MSEIGASHAAGDHQAVLLAGRVGAPSVIDTSEDDQDISGIQLGINNTCPVSGRWSTIVPQVTAGKDAGGSVLLVRSIAGRKEGQAPVSAQGVLGCLGVVPLVDQVISMQTLRLGTGSQLESGRRAELDSGMMRQLVVSNLGLGLIKASRGSCSQ